LSWGCPKEGSVLKAIETKMQHLTLGTGPKRSREFVLYCPWNLSLHRLLTNGFGSISNEVEVVVVVIVVVVAAVVAVVVVMVVVVVVVVVAAYF
jgi:hypothetical protein